MRFSGTTSTVSRGDRRHIRTDGGHLGEPDAEHVLSMMSGAAELAVSAATLAEAGIVAEAKGGREAADDLFALVADLECAIVPLGEEQAVAAVEAWCRFGKGRHPAALNLGDCYSYAAATRIGAKLRCGLVDEETDHSSVELAHEHHDGRERFPA